MSADRWTVCPKCRADADAEEARLREQLKGAYGILGEVEYAALIERVNRPPVLEETFREDREIGVWDNEFSINYRGGCTVCKYSKIFKHTEKVP